MAAISVAILRIKSRLNLWIALGLIIANLFVWAQLLLVATDPHVVEPIMDLEVRALRITFALVIIPGKPGK